MKLLLSALLLAALPAAFAQSADKPAPDVQAQREFNDLVARRVQPMIQAGCPLFLTAANVAAPAGYLPVGNRRPDEGTLRLQFRNQSGKQIASASITATVKVKTNLYALDAHPISLQLRFSGIDEVDRALDQTTQIALPRDYYLFGLAQVRLDRVTFEDGTAWTAPQRNYCGVTPQGSEKIAK